MSHYNFSNQLPAPCIIDQGIIVNKDDIHRLLGDLGRVYYRHTLDGVLQSEGEGYIVEVFCDPAQATLVLNHSLYLNVQSFDYVQLQQSPQGEASVDLVQENRLLRLVPLANPLQDDISAPNLDAATIEAMVTQVLSAKCDVQLDDEEDDYPF